MESLSNEFQTLDKKLIESSLAIAQKVHSRTEIEKKIQIIDDEIQETLDEYNNNKTDFQSLFDPASLKARTSKLLNYSRCQIISPAS